MLSAFSIHICHTLNSIDASWKEHVEESVNGLRGKDGDYQCKRTD